MSNPTPITPIDISAAFPGVVVLRAFPVGGQKYAFDATHPQYGRVAVKVLRSGSTSAEDRALREIQAVTILNGPGFSKIHAYGRVVIHSDSLIFVIEEFLDGGSLRELLNVQTKLDLKRLLTISEELLVALAEVEKHRLVHRDLKPENIMFNNGSVVLIDFGIARHLDLPSLTQDSALVGPLTPGYAAPEQIRNDKRTISLRTDLFALGVVIYEMAAGFNPFVQGCTSANEVLQRGLTWNPLPLMRVEPSVPSELSALVSRLLSKAVHRRPSSAIEVLNEIRLIKAARGLR
jgi:eukaryotic-like serine/threonine-protein kinase